MRTLIFILVSFVLWWLCISLARLLLGDTGSAADIATLTFVTVWFIAAVLNMWIGVSQAGYSLAEELPIFLLIFLLPALLAVVMRWKWL
jgi:hypothetical protein